VAGPRALPAGPLYGIPGEITKTGGERDPTSTGGGLTFYNEEERLAQHGPEIVKWPCGRHARSGRTTELLLVDDSSTDSTRQVASGSVTPGVADTQCGTEAATADVWETILGHSSEVG
jgi:hypothetical protein